MHVFIKYWIFSDFQLPTHGKKQLSEIFINRVWIADKGPDIKIRSLFILKVRGQRLLE